MPGLLCILAHPDDEIFCAGLLLRLSSEGVPVHLVCLTRGEGGQLGYPPRATRETIGQVREQEMHCSAQILNAESLAFLDYRDPLADDGLKAPEHDPATLTQEIIQVIERHRPEVVLTHGSNGDYGHPAHRLAHTMVKAAVVAGGETSPLMYSFNAVYPGAERPSVLNSDDWADFVIDTSAFNEQKTAVFACHVTQWAVFVGKKDELIDYETALAAYVREAPRESYHRHWPPALDQRPDVLQTWLKISPPDNLVLRKFESFQNSMQKHAYFCLRNLKRSLRKIVKR